MQHLNKRQNTEIASLLIGAGKAIFIGSIGALFFPQLGQGRPLLYGILGAVLSVILITIGVVMLKDDNRASENRGRR